LIAGPVFETRPESAFLQKLRVARHDSAGNEHAILCPKGHREIPGKLAEDFKENPHRLHRMITGVGEKFSR